MRLLVPAVLALVVVCPSAGAQIPLDLQVSQAGLFEVLPFDNSRTDVALPPGDVYFVYVDDGPTPAEYWVTRGSDTVAHARFTGNAGLRLTVPAAATYSFHFNGQGTFALVRPELVDNLAADQARLAAVVSGRFALAVGRDAPRPTVCVEADQPLDVQHLGPDFSPISPRQSTRTYNHTFDGSMFSLVFLRASVPTAVEVTVARHGCPPPAIPSVAPHAARAPWWPAGAATLALALARRQLRLAAP